MCTIVSPPPRTASLSHTTTTASYMLLGEPRLAAGMQEVGFDVNVLQASGNLEVLPGYLYYPTRSDRPSPPATAVTGSYVSSTTRHAFHEDLSGTTDQFYVAPVLFYKLSSAGQGNGLVTVRTSWKSSGRMLGTRDVVVNPNNSTDDVMYFPVTGWVPALGADKVMASIVATDVNNAYVRTQLGVRTATDPAQPSTVSTLEGAFDNPGSGNDSRNTGELSLSLSTTNFFQLVLMVKKNAGGDDNSRAIFRVSSALITS